MRKRVLAVTLGLAIAGGATAGIVAVASDSGDGPAKAERSTGFKPDSLEGKWTGKEENETFGISADIRANVQVKGDKFTPLVEFNGPVFGCNDPDPEKVTIKKGSGDNTWNRKGFNVSKETEAFGQLDLAYKHKTGKIEGEGSEPPCNPDITYTVEGTLTSKRFQADVHIDLGGGQKAEATMSVKKR